ncbi:DUF3237 domain-containing protein [Microbaculum marinum]|uniref:UPF0311 protein V3328_26550 n=1 Tax=Microbaculum marinum TaxID=1764581 RepID=A0AAW9RXS8_9HYPH
MTVLAETPFMQVRAELADILEFGATPAGTRRVINILGGTVTGPRLNGRILPGGADWQVIRADGVADISARYTIQTESGALILVSSDGVRHGPPEVIARLSRGEDVDPALYYFRTAMRFETGGADVAWLNRVIAVARGKREANAVVLDVYEVV